MRGGDHSERPHLQLNGSREEPQQLSLFPTEQEQIGQIQQAEDEKSSAFFIPQADINRALREGSGFEGGKYRIYQWFQNQHSTKETVNFLKHEYGTGGSPFSLSDGTEGNIEYSPKGFNISRSYRIDSPELSLTWNSVARQLHDLVLAEKYLTPEEREQLEQPDLNTEPVTRAGDTITVGTNGPFHQVDVTLTDEQYQELQKAIPDSSAQAVQDAEESAESGAAASETEKETERLPIPSESEIQAYGALREKYPETLIAFQVGDYILFYGDDAKKAAPPLNTKILESELSGIGKIPTTGVPSSRWPTVLDPLCEKGYDVLISGMPNHGKRHILKYWTAKGYLPIGGRITVDGRHYEIESVDFTNDKVSLKDLLQKSAGLPNPRVESISYVRSYWEEQSLSDENSHLFYEEAQRQSQALKPRNFRITDGHLGEGGQKTKFGYNLAAIRTLKQIEAEGRTATPEEQGTLSRYVGWGGIPQAFDPENTSWTKEYTVLKGQLTDEEYSAARASVLNAHYTSPAVIEAVYGTLERFGFRRGNILEPACGIGNFFGLVPERMKKSKLYGVELDSITGRIARQLYPEADITVQGFEKTDFPDNFFDLAVGNVPFGEYQLPDRRYDRYKFLIHDYFFAKALDKVRPGGLVAFITSKGTMDKKGDSVRRYLSQRAVLLGAVRLPNTAFLKNAGTEATSDILFFQKRGSLSAEEPEWLKTGETEDGVPVNQYYLEHPQMMLGKMAFSSRMYGNAQETTCNPTEGTDFEGQLKTALSFVSMPNREELDVDGPEPEAENPDQRESIPADPDVRNFSYTFINGGGLYFRENSVMNPVDVSAAANGRICGMVEIRDCTRHLIDLQMDSADDTAIQGTQERLNTLYDTFTGKYGLLNSSANRRAFQKDSSYCLLCSLEVIDEDGSLERKADMFTKRTIRQRTAITSVNTPSEALTVSLGEKARVDPDYMASLLGGPEKKDAVIKDLQGIIFKNPDAGGGPYDGWQTSDEYLSGNVRQKLQSAREAAKTNPSFSINVAALQKVQPKDLDASEIDVRLGATWVDPAYIDQFMYAAFDTPAFLQGNDGIRVRYSSVSGVWNISGKGRDSFNSVPVYVTYGTGRANAYKILEDSLNLKTIQIFDQTEDADGAKHQVLNPKETAVAQQKQEAVKQAFRDWIWKDPQRREDLCRKYNTLFNSTRPREYDGSHLTFPGMNPEITLRPHQLNAVAHVLYGGNTLLAHCVGAGKTYEMAAAAMESKRLGLCHKSLFVVPNHLTEQWGGDFLRLYPGANILVATRRDFEPMNRKKFCARIATGDYDAVVIGHSQFEKIPVSKERQAAMLREQIDDIEMGINQAKHENGENFTVKQMEKTRKSLEARLERLNDDSRKDDVVTFEELGIDRLFVDEADSFKNLFLYTKMRNVAGVGQTEAQKSTDMYTKCRYMDELTGGRGITFATGTPISNSMTELYTMMRYLQYDTLQQLDLGFFDSWAAAFGETVTATELTPEGTGFRTKTRFAHFFNLPELMSIWKEAADIQTADMLKLPVPEAEYVNVVTQPTDFQKASVKALGKRAEDIRSRLVNPSEDNMLKVTGDGRTLALDQRLMNPMLPDDPNSKVNACVKNILDMWRESATGKGTQLVFCDLSTPKQDADAEKGGFTDVYHDIRRKLIQNGVPESEIAFIHSAKTEAQKSELFAKVRKGQVRVLLGSTAKMGAGTNVQDRLIAEHHLDCPWKPRDIEQREGRILRQGNRNPKVKIFRYVTENTFDAYNWQLIENKAKFISQVMTSKSPARSCEDIDDSVLSYAEVKALAAGDPRIKEKMDLDIQVTKLKMIRTNFQSQHYQLEDKLLKFYPAEIQKAKSILAGLQTDLEFLQGHPAPTGENYEMQVKGMLYGKRKEAGAALMKVCRGLSTHEPRANAGQYRGFTIEVSFNPLSHEFCASLKNSLSYPCELGTDPVGNTERLDNALDSIPQRLEDEKRNLETLNRQTAEAKEELKKTFPQEQELAGKTARLNALTLELDGSHPEGPPERDGESNTHGAPPLKAELSSVQPGGRADEGRQPEI